VGPAQGSGPIPDDDLTENATSTEERSPNATPVGTLNRVCFVTQGVDLDEDGLIDPELPPFPFVPNWNIWIMRPDGSEQVQITTGDDDEVDPVYNPGGNIIAYASNETGTWQIYTIEYGSGIIRQITRGAGNKRHPTWSPDSLWIAFQSDVDGDWNIYRISSDGAGSPIRITTNPGDDTDPAWAPQGHVIAYTAQAGAVTRIRTILPDGSGDETISNGGGDPLANDKEPCWQHDGTTIAFSSDRLQGPGDTLRDYNIWRMAGLGEVIGGDAILRTNEDITDQYDDENPVFLLPQSSQPLRLFYESNRPDAVSAEVDIWDHQIVDIWPPELEDIPSVDNRLPNPGDDIVISVPVFDKDSGIASVRAYFKNPDWKTYIEYTSSFEPDENYWGDRSLEWDYRGQPSWWADLEDLDGDGVFTGVWTTPLTPRDYVIDIVVTDNQANSLRYDDVYGFSTQVFTPTHNILFVNDYCEGQEFISLLGNNNDYPTAFPVESYYTYNPGELPAVAGTIDYNSIEGPFPHDTYDVWRIICRGRIPAQIYEQYLPTIEYQLDPVEALTDPETATPTRIVPVAQRAIIWGAPHTGDVWTGQMSGSVIDAATQADLSLFLDRGGRLMISGGDIAWALTFDGLYPNMFLSNYLKAGFVSDLYYWSGFSVGGQAGDPIADPPGFSWWTGYNNGDDPIDVNTPSYYSTSYPWTYTDAADWSLIPDRIQVIGGGIKVYGYGDYDGADAAVRYLNPETGSRMLYLAFGFEQIHRGYYPGSGTPEHCKNHRSHLINNTMIWMRTATFQGRALSLEGGTPIVDPNPIIRCIQGGQVVYAVRCHPDGTYVINGLPAGTYTLEAFRPGYDIDKYEGASTHVRISPITQDFALKQLEPGAVSGIVTSEASGEFLANVTVTAYETPEEPEPESAGLGLLMVEPQDDGDIGPPVISTLTAADGSYTLPSLPAADYIVIADGSAVNHGTVRADDVTVLPGGTARVDFALPAADGTLKVTVTDATTTDPIANALVEIEQDGVKIADGRTDALGEVEIDLQPGTYDVIAEASGYERSDPQGAYIESLATTDRAFALTALPPGSLSGSIVSVTSGLPIGDVLLRLKSGETVIGTTMSSDTFTDPGDGTNPYNYIFTDVPTGTVTVEPAPVGFTPSPPTRSARVETDTRTMDINFTLSALKTFPVGLQLISMPWDYEFVDPATLLGVPPASFLLAAYEPATRTYQVYPMAPADRFRLGRAYWMKLYNPADLNQEGVSPADPTFIPLEEGWNLIGCPADVQLDFYTVEVEDRFGVVRTLTQAMALGQVQGTMFAYVLGGYQTVTVLTPYVGYWLKTGEPVTLHVSKSAGTLAAGQGAARPAVPVPDDGWLLNITTSVAGLCDTSSYIGAAGAATNGRDNMLDLVKPPAPDMAPYVYAAVVHEDWGTQNGSYAVDIRSSGDAKQTWDLQVSTNMIGEPVTLCWPDMSSLPRNIRPVLLDLSADKRVYMRTSTSYTFTAQDAVRDLRIVVDRRDGGVLAVTGLTATSSGSTAGISYTLSQAAAVSVEVRNISGVLVRQLIAGEAQEAGVSSVLWDLRNARGTVVPAGRYLVRVTARTEDGQQTSAIGALMIQR